MPDYNIIDPKTTFILGNCKIGKGVIIYPFNVIENSSIGDGTVLLPFNHIVGSQIGGGCRLASSFIELSRVKDNCRIGPFAHLRPDSQVECGARIGNFVEIKNSTIGSDTKVSHLSYVGDATIGKGVNIGCGAVFVNFNGKVKQRSFVGDGSFVGSSVNLIAPVKIGQRAFICAGTTVDADVKDGAMVIGRSRMVTKDDRAKDYLKGE